ncbi:DNA damage-induced apoptosis suppressor protein isoform X1 [Mauremys reevesii]|uniref:DNA damage-induced apoptosis suppressor protein isoform X1 n=1 Tax=Mauremys reevesii TaxID=260615 RepID=UPI00193FED5B|nr:DNA damage-induced apoptosis suppressor protein isoform X1 [Mauremys reevesii]XP_039391738.1 DNA damage-induced apoptosis suppressor protein isoform X1 [Mauremys reevesii]XP_039391748.1 DNA damage-induced apoptosis suppressor protein isoform X1 [Mauremys reevesii]XP_039391757.1 DNA damage-induced apoptosis suppressor protein isoform X1 [Mauremys reevesii]XP_039391766.1 DNA damage-induced apoptosis suppressor protein isoform X1 [Mauremys reevesii]
MNGRRRLLAASVISVQNSSFVYPSCQNCFSKLILNSNRFNCLKCGCTGEAKDANYRYKLSLKVAGTSDLFDITVFGSTLEPFFGVTAGSLQRYIQDFNQVSGELDRDASPRVLIQAVKTCFIGRRFIFGVKSSENHDGGHSVSDSILPNGSRINRLTRDLTACQIFLPNTAAAGFTVISYFHRLLQSANFRSSHSSSQRPDCPFIAVDQPSSELSSLCSSGSNSCFVQSSGRESFSVPWQQSFGLTSSSVEWVTTEDFSSLELGKAAGEQCELQERGFSAELCSLSPSNQTIQDLQLCNSMNERNEQEDRELSSLSSRSDTITATEKLESCAHLKREWSPDRNSSRLLQSPLDLGVKYSRLEIISRHDYCQEKSWNSLLCQRKDDSFCFSAVSPNHGSATGTSQDDPMIWDELPFSESLNDFIARIENRSTISPVGLNAHKCSLRERNELDENHSKTSCRQGIVHTACKSTTTTGKFPQRTEHVNTCKEHILSCHQSHLTPVNGQCEPTSTKGGRESDFIPDPSLLVLSQSSAVRATCVLSAGSFLQSEKANVNISNNAHSFTNLQCTMKDAEISYLQRRERPARLRSLYDGCVADWENKDNCSYPPNLRTDLTSSRELGCDSAAPYKAKNTCKRELEPLTKLQENTVRAINQNDVLQNNPNHSKSSYNASADLFEASAREIETMVEFSNKSHNSSAQEDVSTEKYTASELVCSPLDVGCSYLECRSSLSLPPPFGKHSTPISYSLYDSELDLVDTQNFVPYSQSTPVVRSLQKFRSQRGRESVLPKLTSKSPTKIRCKSKQSRPSFKNTLLRQLTSKFPKHKRSSNTAINKSVPQQSFINSEVPENDSKEWIPPSATKLLQPAAFSNLKTVGLQARSPAICKPIDKKTISENKASSGKSRTDTCLRSRKLKPMNRAGIPTTPIPANAAKALLLKDAVSGTCACSETQKSHSCATYLVGGLDEAVSWSPELFTEKYYF